MKTDGQIEYLIGHLRVTYLKGDTRQPVNGIVFDSRKVVPGCLFVAVKGTISDGHDFISSATEAGATAVVCEHSFEEPGRPAVVIGVPDAAEALGQLASAFYGHPSHALSLVGITGTNGKTTTVTVLHNLVQKLGYTSGCFTTIRNYIHNETFEATHTTPDPVQLNLMLRRMVDRGCRFAFMEVSSHALVQHRVSGLKFAGALFSNITHDHLDYHKTFDAYIRAKKLFFDRLDSTAFALVNADDKNGQVMVQNSMASVHTYALKSPADFSCRILESHLNGMLLILDGSEMWTRLIGEFNAYNLLAAYACARLLKLDKYEVMQALSNLDSVEGRFQYNRSSSGITAIVDYAHTPDALSNVLKTIHQLRKTGERIISVVGAGGNRDRSKRPVMAKTAAALSDLIILTSDNPRHEDPLQIIAEMKQGLDAGALSRTIVQPDRAEAIRQAALMANPGDILLIAGKGHETYQEIAGVKYPFSDADTIQAVFESLKPGKR